MLDPKEKENKELALRVKEAIEALPFTKAVLAEKLDVTPQAITGWEKTGRIAKKKLAGLAALTGSSINYFLTGTIDREDEGWSKVLGYAQAVGLGDGIEANEYAETHKLKFRTESLSRKGLTAGGLGVVYGKGDSMLPRVRPGDAILFDTTDTRPKDEALFVVMAQGVGGSEYSVKRCRHFGEDVYFDALNPQGDHQWRKPRKMDDKRHPITIIGRVRWLGSWED